MSFDGIDIEGLVSQIDIDELGLDDASLFFDASDDGGFPAFLYDEPSNRQFKLQESVSRRASRSGRDTNDIESSFSREDL